MEMEEIARLGPLTSEESNVSAETSAFTLPPSEESSLVGIPPRRSQGSPSRRDFGMVIMDWL